MWPPGHHCSPFLILLIEPPVAGLAGLATVSHSVTWFLDDLIALLTIRMLALLLDVYLSDMGPWKHSLLSTTQPKHLYHEVKILLISHLHLKTSVPSPAKTSAATIVPPQLCRPPAAETEPQGHFTLKRIPQDLKRRAKVLKWSVTCVTYTLFKHGKNGSMGREDGASS